MKRDILRLIAVSQLLGGIFTIAGYALIPITGYRFDPAWQAAPGLLFGLYAMASGIALLRWHRWAIPSSLVLQALQIPSLSIAGVCRYVALAGPLVQLIGATTGVRLNAGGGGAFIALPWSHDGGLGALGAHVEAGIGIQPGPITDSQFTVAVNFVAVYFFWHLFTRFRERRQTAISEGSVAQAAA